MLLRFKKLYLPNVVTIEKVIITKCYYYSKSYAYQMLLLLKKLYSPNVITIEKVILTKCYYY